MPDLIILKEKLGRFRFFVDKLRYKREKHLYFAVFLFILVIGASSTGLYLYQDKKIKTQENILRSYYADLSQNTESVDNPGQAGNTTAITEITEAIKIKVYICGYVANPGVYDLDEGARVVDLIEISGGAKENAALEAVNLASVLKDSDMVYIPSIQEIKEKGLSYNNYGGSTSDSEMFITSGSDKGIDGQSGSAGSVNLNHASLEQLAMLPGIGETIASNIIEYREKYGGFKTREELKNVKGIGEKKYEKIKDMISI